MYGRCELKAGRNLGLNISASLDPVLGDELVMKRTPWAVDRVALSPLVVLNP